MAKLDRQIDRAMSIAPMPIVWRAFDHVDTEQLLHHLKQAIDKAESRVPLDCRDVDGTPNELIDVLLDSNEYANQFGKQVTLAFASDELRSALRPTVQRRPAVSSRRDAPHNSAATAAHDSLSQRINAIPQNETPVSLLTKGEKLRWGKTKALVRRRGGLVLAIVVGAVGVIGIEYYLVFTDDETINISRFVEEGVIPPVKTFEE
jgi:hypothetical protein